MIVFHISRSKRRPLPAPSERFIVTDADLCDPHPLLMQNKTDKDDNPVGKAIPVTAPSPERVKK